MATEDYVRIFPAQCCLFVRVTPRLVRELRDMTSWPAAERRKWSRRLMRLRHWASLSEAERRRDPVRYVGYKQALEDDCPATFPVLAKDVSERDTSQMTQAEAWLKLNMRFMPTHAPVDGDGPWSQCFAY